jgi:hypothetical protein
VSGQIGGLDQNHFGRAKDNDGGEQNGNRSHAS